MAGQFGGHRLPGRLRLLRTRGARDAAAEAMRAPGARIAGRRGLGGRGEPGDETGTRGNRRLRVKAVPDRLLAAAVEEVGARVLEARRLAPAREVHDRQAVQRLGAERRRDCAERRRDRAERGGVMRRPVQAMHERRLESVLGDRVDLAERCAQGVVLPGIQGPGRRVAATRQAQRDALGVQPLERIGMTRAVEPRGRAERFVLRVEQAQLRFAVAGPGEQREAAPGLRSDRDRPLACCEPCVREHADRRRAGVLLVRTERRRRVIRVRALGQRQAVQACEPAAGAIEQPAAARRGGGDAPGREARLPQRGRAPAAAQVVQHHAVLERDVEHAVVADREIAGPAWQAQQQRLAGQVRAAHADPADVAGVVGLLDPARQAAVRVQRTRHALHRARRAGERERRIGGRRDAPLARELQHAAAAVPDGAQARREMARLREQAEAELVRVHQQTFGTTGTATALGSA